MPSVTDFKPLQRVIRKILSVAIAFPVRYAIFLVWSCGAQGAFVVTIPFAYRTMRLIETGTNANLCVIVCCLFIVFSS